MSLNVYVRKEDIPKSMRYVYDNDSFFLPASIPDDKFVRDVISLVDNGEYLSNLTYSCKNKKLGALNILNLSTGAKTLINIFMYPSFCFDVSCCGVNACLMLGNLHAGNVYWPCPVVMRFEEYPWNCDIDVLGNHFDDFATFADYMRDSDLFVINI